MTNMDQMQVDINAQNATFHLNNKTAGTYALDDPYKPHFRSLKTPAGHEVTQVSPGDHRHHKGLMYALRCSDLNFWEEQPGSGFCGIQEILTTSLTSHGIEQTLLWRERGGGLATYQETRRISCTLSSNGNAILWSWNTRRKSLRDHRLVKSQHSLEAPDGRKINYHGLGIRLPWMWRFPSEHFCGTELNGEATDPMSITGSIASEAGFWGVIDGCWERQVASVTIRQATEFAWFALKTDFAYLSVGPSNAEEIDISKDEEFEETYEIIVADRPSTFGKKW